MYIVYCIWYTVTWTQTEHPDENGDTADAVQVLHFVRYINKILTGGIQGELEV